MINIIELHIALIVLIIIGLLFLNRYLEKGINKVFKKLKIKNEGIDFFLTRFIYVLFNIGLLFLLKISLIDLFNFNKLSLGLIMIASGVAFATLVSRFSYQISKKTNVGDTYKEMVKRSPVLVFASLLLLIGPAEDLFFLAIIQNTFTQLYGWVAIIIYLIIFTGYHYINVLVKAETKKEFFGMLPIRLIISTILSLSFYFTGSIIYTMIIHNLFDSIVFVGILLGALKKEKNV